MASRLHISPTVLQARHTCKQPRSIPMQVHTASESSMALYGTPGGFPSQMREVCRSHRWRDQTRITPLRCRCRRSAAAARVLSPCTQEHQGNCPAAVTACMSHRSSAMLAAQLNPRSPSLLTRTQQHWQVSQQLDQREIAMHRLVPVARLCCSAATKKNKNRYTWIPHMYTRFRFHSDD